MTADIFKSIYDNGLIWLYMVELISSDTNLTNEDRSKHITLSKELYNFLGKKNETPWLLDKERRKLRKHCKQAIETLTKEIEEVNNGNIN